VHAAFAEQAWDAPSSWIFMKELLVNAGKRILGVRPQGDSVAEVLDQTAGYGSVAVLAPVQGAFDPQVESVLQLLAERGEGRFSAVLAVGRGDYRALDGGIPRRSFEDASADSFDAVCIPFPAYAEVLFHFFNGSSLRELPIVAIGLRGLPHRLFFRRLLEAATRENASPNVLEVGAIEHNLGGHLSTLALAEGLWGRGVITTIDLNPHALRLSEYYCASTPTRLHCIEGDCVSVLANPARVFPGEQIDFALFHFISDNADPAYTRYLIEAFGHIEDRLSPQAPLVFQSVETADPRPGSLQHHLKRKGWSVESTAIHGSASPPRFFQVARQPAR
jgi:hypothetical protein